MSKEDEKKAVALGKSEMEKRLAALRHQTFDELAALPDHKTDNFKSGKYEVKVTTYRDNLDDDVLQVAVQWYFRIRLGFGQIGADGFTITRENVVRDMEEKALYEFM
ncbi:MAG: hypothetical protein OEN22_01250 [Gammaproteobacteria bacterium]|nr:hypothetical protein [Gammaproteobacteria bacterium]